MSKKPLLRRAAELPLKGVNVLTGGNAVDVLHKSSNPRVRAIVRRAVKAKGPVDHKAIQKALRYTGDRHARFDHGVERMKTHAARGVTGAAAAGYAIKKSRKASTDGQQQQG